MLDQMITDAQLLTATNSDVLAGTQLDQPGVPGVYTIFAASDVADSTITVSMGGRTIVNGAVIVERANAEILEDSDPFFTIASRTGGRPVVNIVEVTAANIRVVTRFLPAFVT